MGSRLCMDVRSLLQELQENDGSVRPEMVTAIYGHLSVCADCARYHAQLQALVDGLDSVPAADLPADFSASVMARLPSINRDASGQAAAVAQPALRLESSHQSSIGATELQAFARLEPDTRRRLTMGAVLSAALAWFLSSAWSRQMLGANATVTATWLDQAVDLLARIPLLGWLVGIAASALAESSGIIATAYSTLAAIAVRGILVDAAVITVAYAYVLRRRQNEQRFGI